MPGTRAAGQPRQGRALAWLVILLAAYFIPRGLYANPDSHLALTYALVERHTMRIDAYLRTAGLPEDLLDKAIYCGPRTDARACTHYYSDKAPGLSLAAVPVYAALRLALPEAITAPRGGDRYLLRWLLTVLVVGVPCGLFASLLLRFLSPLVGRRPAALATLGYALGSIALPFATLFFSHALAAALLCTAFVLLVGARRASAPQRWRTPLAGALAGYAVGCEYPTAIIAALMALYALTSSPSRSRPGRAAAYALGAAAGLLPALAYNVAAFGAPLAQGYAHLSGDSVYARGMAAGLFGVGLPTWEALWGTSFSPYRGLFFLSPWLLLALPGLRAMARRGWRAEAWLCGTVTIAYFLFQAGYRFWDGGASTGPRHFLPALPFLAIPAAFALADPRLARLATSLIAASALALVLVIATNPLFGDPRYVPGLHVPLLDQTLHAVATGRWQNNWGMVLGLPGAASLLPLALGLWLLTRAALRQTDAASMPSPNGPPGRHERG